MVRCDDPPQLSDPPPWWFLLLYYLMQRCAGPNFSEELHRRVNILSQRYYDFHLFLCRAPLFVPGNVSISVIVGLATD